ncbi:MAG: hypothetical protein V1886_01830 [archaeon]
MKLYHLILGSIDGKPAHHTVGDKRDWFYVPGRGIIIRRYNDMPDGKNPCYWFSQDSGQIMQVEDYLKDKNKLSFLKLVKEIEFDKNEDSILEEIISHAQVYNSEQKKFVDKVRMFDKYSGK